MNATILCLAAALFVLPSSSARRRLRRGVPDAAPRPIPRALVVGVMVVVLATVVVWAGITPAVAGATVATTAVWRRRARRRAAELDRQRRMLLSGLDTVIADLRVGAHPADACETAARETAGSVADAFRVAAARARLGGSAAHGLRSATASSNGVADSLGRVADAWAVSDRHGLALAELLGAARIDLAARMRSVPVRRPDLPVLGPRRRFWRDCRCSGWVSGNSWALLRSASSSPVGSAA